MNNPCLQLCKLMWAQPEIDLPQKVVEHAAEAPFTGVLPARTAAGGGNSGGPPGVMGPPHKLARITGPPVGGGVGGIGGDRSGGVGAGSLQLPHQLQQQQQMQGQQFDGPPGFLFEIESQVRKEYVQAWVWIVPDLPRLRLGYHRGHIPPPPHAREYCKSSAAFFTLHYIHEILVAKVTKRSK